MTLKVKFHLALLALVAVWLMFNVLRIQAVKEKFAHIENRYERESRESLTLAKSDYTPIDVVCGLLFFYVVFPNYGSLVLLEALNSWLNGNEHRAK